MRSPSRPGCASAPWVWPCAVFLLVLLLEISPVHGADIVFQRCPENVVAYFQKLFPEWKPETQLSTGRRLEEEVVDTSSDRNFVHEDDLTSRLQGVFSRPKRFAKGPRVAGSGDAGGEPQRFSDPLKRASRSIVEEFSADSLKAAKDSFRAPPNAYRDALALGSGCSSCKDGCCDGADVELHCGYIFTPRTYTPAPSEKFSAMIYRVRVKTSLPFGVPTPPRSNIWVLQGGPGGSGLSILGLAVHSLQFATDVYVPDHRGTGRSLPVACPNLQSAESLDGTTVSPFEVTSCEGAAYGRGTPFELYTVTNAAKDLAFWINDVKSIDPTYPTYIHAYSYGTRWATRLLKLHPDIADKVVLEGNVPTDTYFDDYTQGNQDAGDIFMAKCAMEPSCLKQFPDANVYSAFVTSILSDGKRNPCTGLLLGTESPVTAAGVRQGMQFLLNRGLILGVEGPYASDTTKPDVLDAFVDFRTLSLAMMSRWKRCGGADTSAKANSHYHVFLASLMWVLSLSGGYAADTSIAASALSGEAKRAAVTSEELQNSLLYKIVSYGEMRKSPFPYDSIFDFESASEDWYWGNPGSYRELRDDFDAWKKFIIPHADDPLILQKNYPVNADLLVINGELDGQTPHYKARQQISEVSNPLLETRTLAIVQDAGHHATFGGCGLTVARLFYNPSLILPSCSVYVDDDRDLDAVPPVRRLGTQFKIPARFNRQLQGVASDDAFEGGLVPNFCTPRERVGRTVSGCIRCFDYCMFLAELVGDACDCASNLGTCLNDSGESFAVASATCYEYTARWSDLGIDAFEAPSGACYRARSCNNVYETNELVMGSYIWGLVIGFSVLGVLCFMGCVFYQLRANRNRRLARPPNTLEHDLEVASRPLPGGGMVIVAALPVSTRDFGPNANVVQAEPVSAPGGDAVIALAYELDDFHRLHDPTKTMQDCQELAEWAMANGGREALNQKLISRYKVGLPN